MDDGRRAESVLVVVASRDGRALLLRRRRPAVYWQSVTGALGWDETPARAAQRELAEETGIEAQPRDCARQQRFRIDPRFGHRYASGMQFNTEHHFELLLDTPCRVKLAAAEHAEYRWLALADALRLVSSPTNRLALAETARGLGALR